MGFLLYEHGVRNDNTTPMISLDDLLRRKLLPTIYVHSQADLEELQGLLFLAGQDVVVRPMADLPPTDIICNAHYIAAYPLGIRKWT